MTIKMKNVNKIYKSGEVETLALKDINLEIQKGEFIVILGPSGSGKSTMLNVISGLDTPTSGEIIINDEDISNYNEEKLTRFRRKHLGFIFQQYNLLQSLNVEENIEMGAAIGKNPLNSEDIIKAVGLQGMEKKYPYQLSGGEQQRVSIARSICKNPNILFCDEPTGALDEKTGKQVLEIIQNMNEKYKTTTILITHNPSIAHMADRIIKMNSGRIVEEIKVTSKWKARDIQWA
ncbi:ABC transporter ATP-binding protein [Clostridium sp.]|uniref:ABC transporter ATP-binding protein n=1 Tax=Clostridium sp. TaxID=1506 RepID=UPI0032180C29